MELEIKERYNHIEINVNYLDLRKYQINVTINNSDNKLEIIYLWDVHQTQDENINAIIDIIDRFILKIYKKGE